MNAVLGPGTVLRGRGPHPGSQGATGQEIFVSHCGQAVQEGGRAERNQGTARLPEEVTAGSKLEELEVEWLKGPAGREGGPV